MNKHLVKYLLPILIGLGLTASVAVAGTIGGIRVNQGGTGNITVNQGSIFAGSTTNNSLVEIATGSLGSILWMGSNGMPAWTATSTLGIQGGTGLASLNGQTGGTQTFATSTTATGLTQTITSGSNIHTWNLSLTSGYVIPLSASTTEWTNLYNNLYTRLVVSTSSTGTLFYVSTSSPGTLNINYPANVLSTTTAAATYEPILTKGNLTATSPLQFDNTRQVIGGAAAISVASGYAIPTTASSTGWDTAHALRHVAVTLAGENYLSLSGQQITARTITLSGTNVTGVLPIANGGTGTSTAVAASQILVGNGTSYDYTTLPSCSNSTTSKLLYNNTTRTFTCGTDQTGGGSGATTTITSNAQADGPNFTFATGTMTGLNLNITGSGSTVTFSPQLQSGYVIPLSASTTEWATARNIVTASSTLWDTTYTWGNHATAGYALAANLPSTITCTGSQKISAYDSSTHTFTCSTDQTGGGGGSTTTITSNVTVNGPDFTFATSSVTGLNLNITGSGSTVTFSPQLQSGYNIPLTASTTQWADFYNTPSTRITVAGNLSWQDNLLTVSTGFTIPRTASTTEWATARNIVTASSTLWDTAYTWGNHAGLYPTFAYASSTFPSFSYGTSTYATIASYPTYTYASSSYFTLFNVVAGSNITVTTSTALKTIAVSSTPTFTSVTTTNASTTSISVTNLHLAGDNGLLSQNCLGTDAAGKVKAGTCGASLTGGSGGKVALWSTASALTTGLLLDGSVAGVNATSSTVTFNLQGTSNVTPFVIASSTGATLLQVHRNGSLSVGTTTATATLFVQGTSTLPTLNLVQIASSSGSSLFTVTYDGKVGINSSVPSSMLTAEDTKASSSVIKIGGPAANSLPPERGCIGLYDYGQSAYVYMWFHNGTYATSTSIPSDCSQ